MYDAYIPTQILKKLPLQIESAAAYDDKLLIGTRQGHLLVYKVVSRGSSDGIVKYDVNLSCSNKFFAKKPIVQLCAIPELSLLISLSDNAVTVNHLSLEPNTPPIDCPALAKCKGCTLFSVNVQKQTTLTGEVKITLMLCAAVKRKLELFYWKNNTFCEHPQDLCVPDTPRSIVWCADESLLIGFRSEYNILKLCGDTKQLFPTGKQPEPLCVKLKDDSFALGRDEMTIFVNSEGQPTHKYAVNWSEPPVSVSYDYPYLISVQSFGVEIRTIEPRLLIQRVTLQKPKLIVFAKNGQLYIASGGDIWCLVRTPIQDQIPQVLKEKNFELALKLAELLDATDVDLVAYKRHIQNLHAFDLFCKKKFEESMTIFVDLETDPSHVIGLFPDLLPADYRRSLEYPDQIPELRDTDREAGLFALVDYLVQVRRRLLADSQHEPALTGIVQGSKTIKSRKQLLQIIDTTLLKCYLRTNVALVSSLLRLPDNYCHLEACETELKEHQKLSELIILYQTKNEHRKALDLLSEEARKPDSVLKGPERAISYLQQLGKDQSELVFEYSKWVVSKYPEEGLKIFTELQEKEAQELERHAVLNFLSKSAPTLVIPYLEHVIYQWDDQTEMFHNTLIHKYTEVVRNLIKNGNVAVDPGDPGPVGKTRADLVRFLESSERYTAENFPTHLLSDGLFEEAAVVMGKLGRHNEALEIYIRILRDPTKADRYCQKQYQRNPELNRDVFLTLLQMYLEPPNPSSQILSMHVGGAPIVYKPHAENNGLVPGGAGGDVKMALRVLALHTDQIDPLRALRLLPPELLVSDVRDFLRKVLDRRSRKLHDAELYKSLLFAENLQVQERWMRCKSIKLVIAELDSCGICQKRIGKSAFARFPDGAVVHYSCKDAHEAILREAAPKIALADTATRDSHINAC
ncbi:vam6/Vps39-like protein [Ixodes scapularis]|uniref:vam6/Vps39-like protein n=1 Tax=Ixodes scapularis TaxID=6945 RepID=UPI001A9CDFEC|nr:vam6/Vps39-like protein [Ixodes scapularis]